MFLLRWLGFALFHVEAQSAVQVSKALKTAGGVCYWLDAAVVVYKVHDWCGGEDSGQGGEHVTESVVGPYAGSAPEEEYVVEPQCRAVWSKE